MLEEVDITSSSSGVPIHSYMSTATVLTPCGIQRTTTYATACYVCGGGGGQLVQNYDFISKSYFYLQFHKDMRLFRGNADFLGFLPEKLGPEIRANLQ